MDSSFHEDGSFIQISSKKMQRTNDRQLHNNALNRSKNAGEKVLIHLNVNTRTCSFRNKVEEVQLLMNQRKES